MTVLGSGGAIGAGGASLLGAVPLALDEMQFLLEKLELDDMPVVLDALGRYDNQDDHDRAMTAAADQLAERELLTDHVVAPELEQRLRILNTRHWVLAVRWVVGEQVNRFCLARGDEQIVLAMRGIDSYIIDDAPEDLAGAVLAALGQAPALELYGLNAPTEDLAPVFEDTGDVAATADRLAKIGKPVTDAQVLASALVEIESYAEIVGVVYGDGTREVHDSHIAVFNTRAGRFIITATMSDDDVKWSSIATGSNARLRTALNDLIEQLPLREEFTGLIPRG